MQAPNARHPGRHPVALAMAVWAVVQSTIRLTGVRAPTLLDRAAPHVVVTIWAMGLLFGGVIYLWQACVQRRLTALLLERVACSTLAVSGASYLIAVSFTRPSALTSLGVIAVSLIFVGGGGARAVQVNRDLRYLAARVSE